MSAALFDPAAAGGVLPQSRTYTHRSWLYVPDPADPERGELTISLQKGKGIGSKLERDRYLVERQPPPVGFVGHVFLLVNQTDPTQADAYQVFVGRRDGEQFCTCKAGQCLKKCKHVDCIRAALDDGLFSEPRAEPATSAGPVVLPAREAPYEERNEMLINGQNASAPQRNDEDYNVPSDVYLCEFRNVEEIPAKQGDTVPRLVFEFEIVDGDYKGKKLSTFVRKNLFPGNSRGALPSHLFKLAKSFGVSDPMAGFDTNAFLGKRFKITAKNETGQRAWPEAFIPVRGGQPAAPAAPPPSTPSAPAAPPPPGVTAPPPPSPVAGPADDSRWSVWLPDQKRYEAMTGSGVKAHLASRNPAEVMVCAEGSQEVKTALQAGFSVDDSIPW